MIVDWTDGRLRSFLRGTLTLDEAATAAGVPRGAHAGGSVGRQARRLIDQARAGDALASDLVVCGGDLHLAELRTGIRPFVGLLVVLGDLVVDGLYQDGLDPDATVVVTGDLRAQRLISEGFLEVHGSVGVEREALWLDNDGCAEILGDLTAAVLYTRYHSVRVHGRVQAPLIFGDDDRFESDHPHPFVDESDDDHKAALMAVLPPEALSIEGDPDGDPDDWCIDAIDDRVLRARVVRGEPLLRAPWKA